MAPAAAQDWPTRPVTMIVPFGTGSGIDVLGRILAPRLSEILGQPVIVENVGGAGGMIGASRVAKAAPDGYQFVLGNVGTHAQNQSLYQKPLYNAATDFAPVVLIADTPQVLITRTDFPADDLQSFIAYAKANHDKMQYASPGVGSAAHLACLLLNGATGVGVTAVSYRGGALAIRGLDCWTDRLPMPSFGARDLTDQKQEREGNRGTDAKAVSNLAYVTLGTGTRTSEFRHFHLERIFLPRDTPLAIINKLHDATLAAINTPALEEKLKQIGAELVTPERSSSDYLQQFVGSEIKKWAAAIKAGGVAVE